MRYGGKDVCRYGGIRYEVLKYEGCRYGGIIKEVRAPSSLGALRGAGFF